MIIITQSTVNAIENGKQVGSALRLNLESDGVWLSVAIQKLSKEYLSHLNIIKDTNMSVEIYDLDETKSHLSIARAVEYIETKVLHFNTDIELAPLKGQRIFNPMAENILRDPLQPNDK